MITINTRVNLDFLGEEYNESYLSFKSIPMKDLDSIMSEMKKVSEDDSKSLGYLTELVTTRFVEGKVSQNGKLQDVISDDLLDFPSNVITACIERMIGKSDPKS